MQTDRRRVNPSALQQYRFAAGLSRRSLSAVLDASPRAIQAWELGTRQPHPLVLPNLATALGCTVEDLLDRDPS